MAKRGNIRAFLDIPTDPEPTPNSFLPIGSIVLPPSQPRRYFDEEKLQQLAASIKEHGILEPVLVRPIANGKYELVAGERRYRAATSLGLESIPVVVRELSNEKALTLSLVENLEREDLNPVEETEGILALLGTEIEASKNEVVSTLYRMDNEQKGKTTNNVIGSPQGQKILQIFESLGQEWQSFVNNRLPLLKLPEEILEALGSGRIAYTKALAIARVKDEAERRKLLEDAIAGNLSLVEVRRLVKAAQLQPAGDSPKTVIQSVTKKITKSKIWENPDRWQQVQALLKKLEALVEEELSESKAKTNPQENGTAGSGTHVESHS